TQLLEGIHTVTQSDQLRRAHEGEIQRIEEHQGVYAFGVLSEVIGIYDGAITQYRRKGEIGSYLTYQNAHCLTPFELQRYIIGSTGCRAAERYRAGIIHGVSGSAYPQQECRQRL